MNSPISTLPGYHVSEYKIIITPNENLSERIMNIQKDFIEKYKVIYKSVYRPQLILVKFKQLHVYEERIINRLKIVGMSFHPLKIVLKDFGSFPSQFLRNESTFVTSNHPDVL